MRVAYSVETVRAAERALMARVPEGALMQRAAAGLAAACANALGAGGGVYAARVVVLTGSGDNGGDALYAGARLARRGAGVTAVLLAPQKAHRGGLAALRAAGGRAVTPEDVDAVALVHRADLVLDGIVGIGGKGGLRPGAVPLAEAAHASRAVVVAVDLPSGVDADTGEVRGAAVRADMTVTFGTYKPGLLVDPAAEHAGALRLVDIGLGPELDGTPPGLEALQHADVAALLPVPDAESDKYRRGVVGVVAGSERYPGAAVLAVAGRCARARGRCGTWARGRRPCWPASRRRWCRRGRRTRPAGCRPGWWARGWATGRRRGARWTTCSPRTCPCSSTRTACGCWTGPSCAPAPRAPC